MLFTRRRFLGGTGAGLVLSPLVALQARIAAGAPRRTLGFGPLTPRLPVNAHELTDTIVGDLRREPILALPRGFDYRVLSMTGQPMSDGSRVPAGHDGMAAFAGPGGTTLVVRNHEIATLPFFYDFPVVGRPRTPKARSAARRRWSSRPRASWYAISSRSRERESIAPAVRRRGAAG